MYFSSTRIELPGEGIIAIPIGWGVATPKFTVVVGGAMLLVTFGPGREAVDSIKTPLSGECPSSPKLDPSSCSKFNLSRFMISLHRGNISLCTRPSTISLAGY